MELKRDFRYQHFAEYEKFGERNACLFAFGIYAFKAASKEDNHLPINITEIKSRDKLN